MAVTWIRDLAALCSALDPKAVLDCTGKHVRINLSNGARVYVASTPSDHRALLNARRDIRKALRTPSRWKTEPCPRR